MAEEVIDGLEHMKLTADEEDVITIPDEGRLAEIENCTLSLIGKFCTCKPFILLWSTQFTPLLWSTQFTPFHLMNLSMITPLSLLEFLDHSLSLMIESYRKFETTHGIHWDSLYHYFQENLLTHWDKSFSFHPWSLNNILSLV